MLSVRRRLFGSLFLVAWLSIACVSLSALGDGGLPPAGQATRTSVTAVSTPTPTVPDRAGSAQVAADRDFRFERLAIEQGLSQSSVYSIYQDSKGFIWAGTQDGLNKFDGYRFIQFRPEPGDPSSLSHNFVLSIFEDREGALWVGTNGGGLNRYDRERDGFVHYQHDSNSPGSLSSDIVWSVYEDRSGELWVGTTSGLNRYDRKRDRFVHYDQGVGGSELGGYSVRAIFEDRQGALWIGAEAGGLIRLDPQRKHFQHYRHDPTDPDSLSSNMITSICEGQDGALWIGTEGGGLNRFDPGSGHFEHFLHDPNDPKSLGANSIQAVYRDHSGTLWVGTSGAGLNRFDEVTVRFVRYQHDLSDPHSLSDDWIWSIFEDQAGNLWVGTLGGGMNRLERASQTFINYQPTADGDNSMTGDLVWSIYEARDGMLWAGTFGGGLNGLDRQSGRWEHYQYDPSDSKSLSNNIVRAILEDRQGRLWVGTDGGGLNLFDREKGQFTHYRYDPKDPFSLSSDAILAIYEDSSGGLWIGTAGGGLNKFDPDTGRFQRYPSEEVGFSVGNGNVRTIYEDRQGVLWVGAEGGGLNRFDRQQGRFTYYRSDPDDPESLGRDDVMTIYEDRQGVLWIGTFGGGLNKFDRQRHSFVHYTTLDGLPNDVIYGILEDDQGFLWLSTNKGLSRFDPRTDTFRNYDTSDGLQCNEFNSGAYHKSPSGEMFFGGVQGFSSFYPAWVQENPYAPPVVLTSITQAGGALEPGRAVESIEAVTLRWPNNFFEFEFAALNFNSPEKNQYAYKLEKFDKGWNYVGTTRVGRYTNLPGGNYTLRVKGSNNDGVWNEKGVSLQVAVIPPFWATWWFRGAVLLLLLMGLLVGYRLRLRSVEARSRQLEAQVQERTFEIERRRLAAEGLREILEIINSERSIRESLDYIACQAAQSSGAQEALLYRCSENEPVAVLAGYLGDQAGQPSSEALAEYVCKALKGESLLVIENVRAHPGMGEALESPLSSVRYRALLGIPLVVSGEVYGGMALFFTQPRAFSEEAIKLARSFADHAALAIANEQLRLRAERMAVAAERNRLARELHDSAKQKAFAALAQLGAANGLIDNAPQAAKEHVLEAETLVHEVLQELVTLIQEMHPTALKQHGLAGALRELALEWGEKSDIEVQMQLEDGLALPPEVEQAFYRIAQEALANVARHSQAHKVELLLTHNARLSRLSVVDDGCGFDPERVGAGLGLRSMRERAEMHGGKLFMESAPGQGTRLCVEIPVDDGRGNYNERAN